MEIKLPITLLPQTGPMVLFVIVTTVIMIYTPQENQVDIVTPVTMSVIQMQIVKSLPNNVEPLTNIMTSMSECVPLGILKLILQLIS